jgi:cytochrome b
LVVLRLVWGLVGPGHACFTDFVATPVAAWRYFIDLIAMRSRRHLRHSGMMVLALLAGLAFTVWSGMETYAAEDGPAPRAAPQAAPAAQIDLAGAAKSGLLILASDDDAKERGGGRDRRAESVWKDVHETVEASPTPIGPRSPAAVRPSAPISTTTTANSMNGSNCSTTTRYASSMS